MVTYANSNTTRMAYSRIVGFTFIFYIVAGITSLSIGNDSQFVNLLYFFQNLSALVLGVMLYMLTREYAPAIALLALSCRIMEAVHDQSEIFFAFGSLLFCWLLLRGRLIPLWLAWLGVIASGLLVIILPLQLGGFITSTSWASSATWIIWMPMLVFEVVLSLWFIVKGATVAEQSRTV